MVLAVDVLAECPATAAQVEPVQLEERAEEGQFTERLLRAPACTPIQVTFTNLGAFHGVMHNLAIPLGDDQWLFRGDPARTIEPVVYTIPPLPPGDYQFESAARPSLNGVLQIFGAL